MSDAPKLGPDRSSEPDAHAQAALVLVESLIHILNERCVLTVQETVAVLELAADTQLRIYEDTPSAAAARATTLLNCILRSLENDLPK